MSNTNLRTKQFTMCGVKKGSTNELSTLVFAANILSWLYLYGSKTVQCIDYISAVLCLSISCSLFMVLLLTRGIEIDHRLVLI